MENNQAALPEDGATQKSEGKLSLIRGIVGLIVVAVSILCTCLGGLSGKDLDPVKFLGCLKFGAGSDWEILKLMKDLTGNSFLLMKNVWGLIILAVVLIFQLVMFILAIVRFARATKTGQYQKVFGNACGAYLAFLGGQVALLSVYVTAAEKYSLNAAAIAGAVIGGAGIAAMLVLKYLEDGFGAFTDKKTLLHLILTLCTFACAVVVLALVGCPLVYKLGNKWSFPKFTDATAGSDGGEPLLCIIGSVLTMLLILLCALRMGRCLKQLADPSAAQPKKAERTVVSAVFMAIFSIGVPVVAMAILGGKVFAEPIVMMVFGIATLVLTIVDLKFAKKN